MHSNEGIITYRSRTVDLGLMGKRNIFSYIDRVFFAANFNQVLFYRITFLINCLKGVEHNSILDIAIIPY